MQLHGENAYVLCKSFQADLLGKLCTVELGNIDTFPSNSNLYINTYIGINPIYTEDADFGKKNLILILAGM